MPYSLRELMRRDWQKIRAMSRRDLVVRSGAVGAVAGLAAWLLVVVLAMLWDMDKPSGLALLLAIPRGAIFSIVLSLILHSYWSRRSRPDE
jgi:hypothetical protein